MDIRVQYCWRNDEIRAYRARSRRHAVGIRGETALALSLHVSKIRAISPGRRNAAGSQGWDWVKDQALDRNSIVAGQMQVNAIVHTGAICALPLIETPRD